MCYHVIIYKPPTSAPPVVICEDFCLLKALVHLIYMYCLFCHNEDLYSGTYVVTAGDILITVLWSDLEIAHASTMSSKVDSVLKHTLHSSNGLGPVVWITI